MTHNDKSHDTTRLFAALKVLEGNVNRPLHEEFIRFLNEIERAVPARKLIAGIVDNYATHKHLKGKAWLARCPRWSFHVTSTSGSWLNMVENFFSAITRKRIHCGSFH